MQSGLNSRLDNLERQDFETQEGQERVRIDCEMNFTLQGLRTKELDERVQVRLNSLEGKIDTFIKGTKDEILSVQEKLKLTHDEVCNINRYLDKLSGIMQIDDVARGERKIISGDRRLAYYYGYISVRILALTIREGLGEHFTKQDKLNSVTKTILDSATSILKEGLDLAGKSVPGVGLITKPIELIVNRVTKEIGDSEFKRLNDNIKANLEGIKEDLLSRQILIDDKAIPEYLARKIAITSQELIMDKSMLKELRLGEGHQTNPVQTVLHPIDTIKTKVRSRDEEKYSTIESLAKADSSIITDFLSKQDVRLLWVAPDAVCAGAGALAALLNEISTKRKAKMSTMSSDGSHTPSAHSRGSASSGGAHTSGRLGAPGRNPGAEGTASIPGLYGSEIVDVVDVMNLLLHSDSTASPTGLGDWQEQETTRLALQQSAAQQPGTVPQQPSDRTFGFQRNPNMGGR